MLRSQNRLGQPDYAADGSLKVKRDSNWLPSKVPVLRLSRLLYYSLQSRLGTNDELFRHGYRAKAILNHKWIKFAHLDECSEKTHILGPSCQYFGGCHIMRIQSKRIEGRVHPNQSRLEPEVGVGSENRR